MGQLEQIKHDMQDVIGFVEFGEGHRYTDYLAGTDKVAAYGIAGLVAGAVATKAGFFKLLLTALLATKKALVVGAVAAGAFLKRLWTRVRGQAGARTA